jgi:hypothetical protein
VKRGPHTRSIQKANPKFLPKVVAFGSRLSLFPLFLPSLDLILSGFRQRNDLLDIHERSAIQPIRFQTNALNVDLLPENR